MTPVPSATQWDTTSWNRLAKQLRRYFHSRKLKRQSWVIRDTPEGFLLLWLPDSLEIVLRCLKSHGPQNLDEIYSIMRRSSWRPTETVLCQTVVQVLKLRGVIS